MQIYESSVLIGKKLAKRVSVMIMLIFRHIGPILIIIQVFKSNTELKTLKLQLWDYRGGAGCHMYFFSFISVSRSIKNYFGLETCLL